MPRYPLRTPFVHTLAPGFTLLKCIFVRASPALLEAGVALQEIGLDPMMTALEMLGLQGQLFGASRKESKARAHELLELVRLSDSKDRPVGTYSGGMRRRLDLALALVHQPQILFLDEPTTGLDPASRRDVWDEVRRLNQSLGMTIILTTQYLEEADELAEVVAIIDRGKIVAEGSPARLKAAVGTESINLAFESRPLAERALLDGWLATAARANPITYVLEAMRALINSGWSEAPVTQALLACLILADAMYILAIFALRVRTRRK